MESHEVDRTLKLVYLRKKRSKKVRVQQIRFAPIGIATVGMTDIVVHIAAGEEVLSYVGRPVSSKASPATAGPDRDPGAYAQLWQPANSWFDIEIDAAVCRNAGPMVNDFRDNVNSPRSPNTSSRNANLIPRHKYWKVPASAKGSVGSGFPLIIFEAKRRICKGEELLWDYGIGYWETRNKVEEVEDEAGEHQDVVPSLQQTDDPDDSDGSQSQVF